MQLQALRVKTLGAVLAVVVLGGACSSSGPDPDLAAALAALEEATAALEASEAALAAAATTTVAPATTTIAPATTEVPTTTEADAPEPVDDGEAAVLTAVYEWGPSDETVALQELLGIEADGWYGSDTQAAHIAELESQDLGTDNVPVEPAAEPVCPAIDPMPDTAEPSESTFADLDGDGVDEEAFTYHVPGADLWHLRVIDGPDQFDHEIADVWDLGVSSSAWQSVILGALDFDHPTMGDVPGEGLPGPRELFVTVPGGAFEDSFSIFQLVDCAILRPPAHFAGGDPIGPFKVGTSGQAGTSGFEVGRAECWGSFGEVIVTQYATVETTELETPTSWYVSHSKVFLRDHVWDVLMSSGADYISEGADPPIVAEIDCPFE